MTDEEKSKEQLLAEIRALRSQLAKLERAEEARQDIEERFVAFMDAAPSIAWIKDEAGVYIYGNQAWRRLFNTADPASHPVTDLDIVPEEMAHEFRENDRAVLAENHLFEVVEPIPGPDGGVRVWQVIKFPLRDRSGRRLVGGMAFELTERINAEQERMQLLEALGERVKELTALHRTTQLLQDERLTTSEKLTALVDLLPPAFQIPELTAARLRYGALTAQTPNYTERGEILRGYFTTRDGVAGSIEVVYLSERFPSLGDAFLEEERSLVESITEMLRSDLDRKLAEEALRTSEERLQMALSASGMGTWEWEIRADHTRWSDQVAIILGIDTDLREGPIQVFLDAVHPEDLLPVQRAFETALRNPELSDRYEVEFRLRPAGVETRWAHIKGKIFRDETGRPVRLLGTMVDITSRHQLEQQLLHVQKMEAVGRLAGGIAHDFNNLLTVINGYGDLLRQSVEPNGMVAGMIEEICKAGERSAKLTRQLLAYSRRSVLAPVVLDLNLLILELEKMLRRLISEDIDLTVKLDAALDRVKADPGQLEQVIVNLVVNARDAMSSGGALTIETEMVELDALSARERGEFAPGRYVVMTVADTGCGMDEDTLARIFEPFFTTKPKGSGTGLGLSMVFGIVKQSEGQIEVESRVNRGTRFRVYLPSANENLPVASGQAASDGVPRGSETILLAEDEPSVRQLAGATLNEYGYTVLEAPDGGAALSAAAAHAGPVHLLVTDLIMPQMSGGELVRRLRERHPAIKVLFVSGYSDEEISRSTGEVLREAGFLQKPFTPATLARKVREILDDEKKNPEYTQ
ncbi:MAG: response regulator [Acidobacteria bacterium]|nr:response regulator [Acidobacteriota bacterium]MCW5970982.1 response regulator [Blastocatellales bacterium]